MLQKQIIRICNINAVSNICSQSKCHWRGPIEIPTNRLALTHSKRLSGFGSSYNNAVWMRDEVREVTSARATAPAQTINRLRQYSQTQHQQKATAKKKMVKLTEQERVEQLQPLLDAGWTIVKDRDAIYKEYVFGDFNQAFSFMTGVALLAEKLNHHPEWFNVYNKVQVTMSTHDVGGLSAKDIRVANYMEKQAKHFL